MDQTLAKKRNTQLLLGVRPEETKKILEETAGLWRGRKIGPISYQRAARKSYATLRQRE